MNVPKPNAPTPPNRPADAYTTFAPKPSTPMAKNFSRPPDLWNNMNIAAYVMTHIPKPNHGRLPVTIPIGFGIAALLFENPFML